MAFSTFEDILAWQKAQDLTVSIYATFKHNQDFSFRDQIQRASVSITNNIAEGFERQSNQEFRKFIFIAKGSCGEVRSMLRLAGRLASIDTPTAAKLITQATEISKMLSGLIKTLHT